MRVLLLTVALLVCCSSAVLCDTPANCTYEDIRGKWLFRLTDDDHTNYNINCQGYSVHPSRTLTLQFLYPDVVVDEVGNVGKWTLVYNQGFGFVINGMRYFAFSEWSQQGKTVTSKCHLTRTGWFHKLYAGSYPVTNWGCYSGMKISDPINREHLIKQNARESAPRVTKVDLEAMTSRINQVQSSWKAAVSASPLALKERSAAFAQMQRVPHGRVHPSVPTEEMLQQAGSLPTEFDWRNVDGISYVSPVRNQGSCGSCYAFASMGMLECRIRVLSNNTMKPILSTQYVVSCGNYSQGCGGGFPYLVAGQFGVDFGNIEEHCYPYHGQQDKCEAVDPKCKRHYTKSFDYIGGFYGACNEPLMRINLVKEGPLAVSIMVYKDLQFYTSGIYHHVTELGEWMNPFEVTNHVVVIVGYGADHQTGEKFWIVKNSWGENWGEEGYFRIRRGTDEVAIESIAVKATPNISV